MNLYLLRHGEAEPRHYDDSLRALTSHGKQEVINVAKQFAKQDIALTACFHSPYTRTTQTCALFLAESASTVKSEPLMLLTPNHRAVQVLAFLRSLQSEHVLLVTHNPLVSELLAVLTDTDIEMMHIFSTSELNAVHCQACVEGGGMLSFGLQAQV
jgi:phosphohistidine phosphatase